MLANGVSLNGRIENLSFTGAGIAVSVPVPDGETVEIRSARLRLLAGVHHCRRHGDGYLIGIEFCHEILISELQSVRKQQTITPEPPQSYMEKLPFPSPDPAERKR